jgi:predicted amidophosphoribosyltransferase
MFAAIAAAGVVAVALLAMTAAQHRRYAEATALRLCAGCGNTHPARARFCRRCGRAAGASTRPRD